MGRKREREQRRRVWRRKNRGLQVHFITGMSSDKVGITEKKGQTKFTDFGMRDGKKRECRHQRREGGRLTILFFRKKVGTKLD